MPDDAKPKRLGYTRRYPIAENKAFVRNKAMFDSWMVEAKDG